MRKKTKVKSFEKKKTILMLNIPDIWQRFLLRNITQENVGGAASFQASFRTRP
jgi:hypothetical protein